MLVNNKSRCQYCAFHIGHERVIYKITGPQSPYFSCVPNYIFPWGLNASLMTESDTRANRKHTVLRSVSLLSHPDQVLPLAKQCPSVAEQQLPSWLGNQMMRPRVTPSVNGGAIDPPC
ncbi:hypothetical protein CDAR_216421 [Caerostris darwini]|uniref:Uncharacterized protein n=1 Tax=Caerostris darwini TaxID=1538125 RepID=A0AAV4UAX7_9ARAC|nr:hypothetical protein CDAR_216421 [Caerostris darwini]